MKSYRLRFGPRARMIATMPKDGTHRPHLCPCGPKPKGTPGRPYCDACRALANVWHDEQRERAVFDTATSDDGHAFDWTNVPARPEHAREPDEDQDERQTVLESLPPRLAGVLARRMDGDTLGAIAADMGISRQRVNQLEHEAVEVARESLLPN